MGTILRGGADFIRWSIECTRQYGLLIDRESAEIKICHVTRHWNQYMNAQSSFLIPRANAKSVRYKRYNNHKFKLLTSIQQTRWMSDSRLPVEILSHNQTTYISFTTMSIYRWCEKFTWLISSHSDDSLEGSFAHWREWSHKLSVLPFIIHNLVNLTSTRAKTRWENSIKRENILEKKTEKMATFSWNS